RASTRARSNNTDETPLIAGCVLIKKRCSCRSPSSSEASSSADPPLKDAHFCALRSFPNEINSVIKFPRARAADEQWKAGGCVDCGEEVADRRATEPIRWPDSSPRSAVSRWK
ncbi:hypothetical protein PFISCL1PPCAC_9728, partial [Pristionchus fissidentatus]